ncbi:unnamed protein product [Lactuca saligna]|uniref:Uncharacterized protein n=1 Tax=Lactuca saligna TaxID=75948 RepID=A0AA35XZ26_LACSI|nr:unnamed protein product [Lactuca saligna]
MAVGLDTGSHWSCVKQDTFFPADLQGCSLRNKEYIVGTVIFTGHETEVMMNSMNVHSKRSTLERKLDKVIATHFGVLLSLCLIRAIGSAVFVNNKYHYLMLWVNGDSQQFNPSNRFVPYVDDPWNIGLQVTDMGSLSNMTVQSDKYGLRVAINAIGDKANDLILDMYKSVVSTFESWKCNQVCLLLASNLCQITMEIDGCRLIASSGAYKVLVESVLSKVMEELENRITSQVELVKLLSNVVS